MESQEQQGDALSDREEGGPTPVESDEEATGGGPSKSPEDEGFDSHD